MVIRASDTPGQETKVNPIWISTGFLIFFMALTKQVGHELSTVIPCANSDWKPEPVFNGVCECMQPHDFPNRLTYMILYMNPQPIFGFRV